MTRRVIFEFSSDSFIFPLDELGFEFGDKSDEHIVARDIADSIASDYKGDLVGFLRDFDLDSANIFIQLEGFKGAKYTNADVEL